MQGLTHLIWADAVSPRLDVLERILVRALEPPHDIANDNRGAQRDAAVAVNEDGASGGNSLVNEGAGPERGGAVRCQLIGRYV